MQTDMKPTRRMSKRGDAVLRFAAIICVISSVLLAGTYVVLKETQQANSEDYRKRNVLKAFGVEVIDEDGVHLTAEEVEGLFTDHIEEYYLDADEGAPLAELPEGLELRNMLKEKSVLPLYRWFEDIAQKDSTKPTRYAFPISGMGLWGTVYGYLGLEGDLATIKAISFYKHVETPGLGAEVSEAWFTDQFVGKSLWTADNGVVDFRVVKGKKASDLTEDPHAVGGISAATITANGVQKFLVDDMKRYETFFETVRPNQS